MGLRHVHPYIHPLPLPAIMTITLLVTSEIVTRMAPAVPLVLAAKAAQQAVVLPFYSMVLHGWCKQDQSQYQQQQCGEDQQSLFQHGSRINSYRGSSGLESCLYDYRYQQWLKLHATPTSHSWEPGITLLSPGSGSTSQSWPHMGQLQ